VRRATKTSGRPKLQRGDLVEVRSADEILKALDGEGALEGVPFMPEMLEYVGRRFTVSARVERACDTINKGGRVRHMPGTVILNDLRCDGSAHGGCGAGCRLYWKEAWLRRVDPGDDPVAAGADGQRKALEGVARRNTERDAGEEHVYRCQATEFVRASQELGWWDARSFIRELTCRNVSLWRFVTVCARIVVEEIGRRLGLWSYPVKPSGRNAPAANLQLEPGAVVQIRTQAEIENTLNEAGKNRGLWFDREMLPYCGGTYAVDRRVERFIDEGSGRMIELKSDCVILDGVVCKSHLSEGRWFCPRAIYPWWREAWLRPVENTSKSAVVPTDTTRSGSGPGVPGTDDAARD
jgi:hypothetical protein